jgi:hypothetical protein
VQQFFYLNYYMFFNLALASVSASLKIICSAEGSGKVGFIFKTSCQTTLDFPEAVERDDNVRF